MITLEIEYNHNKGHYTHTSGELSNPHDDGSVLNLDRLRVPFRESKGMGKLTRQRRAASARCLGYLLLNAPSKIRFFGLRLVPPGKAGTVGMSPPVITRSMVRNFELAIWSPSYRDADMAFKEPVGLAPPPSGGTLSALTPHTRLKTKNTPPAYTYSSTAIL